MGVAVSCLLFATTLAAHDPGFTSGFDRSRCTFSTTGSNPYFPLWPGHATLLEGVEVDGEELVELEVLITVSEDTELVDGVLTREVVEREKEDGELVEISYNYFAHCRETGDVWYFGEDVDDYEGGVIVGHGGAWRAGENGALPGVFMMGSPMLGARYQQEYAPGVAEDRGEVTGVGGTVDVPLGTYTNVLSVIDTNALNPGPGDLKIYAPGVGNIVDEVMELTEITTAPCVPDATTHCLLGGRFLVTATWENFSHETGDGYAILASDQSGEFWFFGPGNTELLVKVIDACDEPGFNSFWVFAAGLTNVGVTLTVEDTKAPGATHSFENSVGTSFAPILDTTSFATCP